MPHSIITCLSRAQLNRAELVTCSGRADVSALRLAIKIGSGYLQSGSAHRRRTLAYLQSRDEPIKALGSSHMTK